MAWLDSWSKLAPCLVALVFLTKVDAKNKTVTYGTKCAEDQFDCGYQDKGIRKCIPLEWQCDNIVDCENSQKDEFNCRYIHNCKPGFLACRDGDCVEGEFKCNGFDDCGDGSDERGCNGVSHLADPGSAPTSSDLEQCSEGWFRCTRGPCIQNEAKCDGIDDCPEKDDESDCSSVKEARGKSCLGHQFKCAENDVCIPLSWKCNGNKDCIDGSDEAKCKEADQDLESLPSREEYHELTLNNNICPANQFLCEPGNCIPKEKLCDGTKDCTNGNDEGGRCGDCSGYGCTYKCIDSPDGPTCWCVEGEELAADGRTCVDINECDSHKGLVCSHRCINTEGSFECSCVDGYELAADAHTCTAQPDPWASVLFSLGSEVRHMTPSKSGSMRDYGVSQHNELVGTVVRSLTFAPRTNELLMAISDVDDQGSIHTSVNGVQKCLLSNMIGVANIAFDWVTSNIYYTAQRPSELTGVGVCDLKGRFCKLLVKGSVSTEYYRRQVYRGLVVNPNHATMYWMDIPGNFDNPKIMMSDMDGANVKMLLTSKLEHPQGLAMDYIRQHLYYADIELQLIERIDVRTRDRMTVVTRGLHHPYELAFFDNHLYWTDWGTEAVLSYNVNTDDTPHVVHSLEHMPYGITINHTLYWNTSMVDPCNDLDCDHLCVLSRTMKDEIVGRCLCPNFYREDPNQGCIPLNWTELENSNLTRTAPALCPSLMAERCEKNMGCMNLAECHVSNSEGKVRSVKCRCETGYSGLYCELGDGFYATKMDVGIGAWLPISIFLVLVIMLAVLVYFSSEKCPFIRDMGDALMPLVHRIHPREDKQHIVTPKSMSFESDSFENPSYGKGHDQDHHQCTPLSSGGSPTYNTLPEPAPIIKEDPKSTKGFDISRQP